MPNFIEIGGVTRKPLVDLTWNDPYINRMSFDMAGNDQNNARGFISKQLKHNCPPAYTIPSVSPVIYCSAESPDNQTHQRPSLHKYVMAAKNINIKLLISINV